MFSVQFRERNGGNGGSPNSKEILYGVYILYFLYFVLCTFVLCMLLHVVDVDVDGRCVRSRQRDVNEDQRQINLNFSGLDVNLCWIRIAVYLFFGGGSNRSSSQASPF